MAPILVRGEGCRVWDVDGREFSEHGSRLRALSLGHPAGDGSLQHVLEPSNGYLMLAERQFESRHKFAIGRKFGSPESTCLQLDASRARAYLGSKAMLIPPGVAHGCQSLQGGTEVFYMAYQYCTPELDTGIRYDDPVPAIPWPLPVGSVGQRDRSWPLLSADEDRGDGT